MSSGHHHGTCHGGPMHGATMTHGTYAYRLAYLVKNPMRAVIGMVSSRDPEIAFGVYVFDATQEVWNWREAASSVHAKSDASNQQGKSLVP